MTSRIFLVRHGESVHNVTKDFNLKDPDLTEAGQKQAESLAKTFPTPHTVAFVITSPLVRAVQTALCAFGERLTLESPLEDGEISIDLSDNKARLLIDPDLQERSALPCDTPSEPEVLQHKTRLDVKKHIWKASGERWWVKEGPYAEDDETVAERAKVVRERLKELVEFLEKASPGRDLVLVLHGVFMKFLTGDKDIDLPKAGWKAYHIKDGSDGPVLVPTEVES
jgi:broad specificity phosphatase PhoE